MDLPNDDAKGPARMIRTSEIRERITSSKKLKINATVEEEEKKEEEDLYDMDE